MAKRTRHYLVKIKTTGREGYVPDNVEGNAVSRHRACRFSMSSAYRIVRAMRKMEGVIWIRAIPA